MTVITIITGIILFAVFMRTHSKHRRPALAAIANMLLGTAGLIAASMIFGGIRVNIYTVFAALTLGLPGAAAITIVKLIIIN